jgi:hypothetical protein
MGWRSHIMPYTVSPHTAEAAQEDRAAGLAFFLQENVGSIFGTWSGNMKASDQRALFGRNIGKGLIYIDGAPEQVSMTMSVAFGAFRDTVFRATWADLTYGITN